MSAARILRHARLRAGMTQRDLAEATGIRQPAIARIEAGAASPRYDTLSKLLDGAGTALESATQLGRGVDRTLIRESLRRTPEERIVAAGHAARNLAHFLAAVRRGSRA